MKKVVQYLYSLYVLLIFIIVMLAIFPFVIIASLFGKITGGNIIYTLCRLWADVALFCWGISHKNIFEAPKVTNTAAIFVFNHCSYIDIPFLLKAFRKQPIRILAKAEMAKVPIFGYIYKKATVMVDRSSEAARQQSVAILKKVLAQNISVVLAPEGTFNMSHLPLKSFYNGAFKIAVETNTVIQPVLFLDAYDRLHYNSIFSMTPGISRAVFLEPIQPGNDVEALKQQVYIAMENALIKYQASWIK
ncbi:lysophospholipid acyltransferase family protein [Ferruginibacter yonginensis]|uniref:Lysophospholipid acyltransferase family protein n=1 Tax=Ferruginibacter yonginensis TaxID=1310416 RepID=A0ABV8QXD4_9BACT